MSDGDMSSGSGNGAGSAMRIVIFLVVIAVAVVGVLYFTSDVYRTKIRSAADQYAHWTPENIAKDPESYLSFCEEQANKALLDLKASEISIAQNRGRLSAMQEDAGTKITVGEKALVELKSLFTKTEAEKSWPAEWQGQKRDSDYVKQQIVSLYKQVEGQKNLKVKITDAIKKLDAQVTRVQTARGQTQEQLAEVKTSREMLKVQKLTDDLTTRLVSIKSVLQATISTVNESSAPVTLDQLAAQAGTAVDTAEFDKIMAK